MLIGVEFLRMKTKKIIDYAARKLNGNAAEKEKQLSLIDNQKKFLKLYSTSK